MIRHDVGYKLLVHQLHSLKRTTGHSNTLRLNGTVRCTLYSREYWMICREPSFLAVVWFGSSPTTRPPPVSKLDRRPTGRLRKRELADGRGEDPKHTTGFSINHSILSGAQYVALWNHFHMLQICKPFLYKHGIKQCAQKSTPFCLRITLKSL